MRFAANIAIPPSVGDAHQFDVWCSGKQHGKEVIRRFRPVGVWREEEGEFIFLIGCEKANGVYTPAGAFDLALAYKTKLENGEGETCEHY